MKHSVNNDRMTSPVMQIRLRNVLLAVVLVTASLPAFSGTNHPPVITGIPATSVAVGRSYNFQPTASDPDGNALKFKISNKPAWASFSTTTGRLSGTPGTGSIGTYLSWFPWVSDRKKSASLPAFSIQVSAASSTSSTSSTSTSTASVKTGSITLKWTAPVKRADGTPMSLADIEGYHIHYGKSAGSYTSLLNVANGTATSVTVTDLPLGSYYIVMTTYDVAGRESGYSSMVTKTVQ
jgi:hypothetical protein